MPGWQKLANRIRTPVYCPSWVPSPLDAKIGGQWSSGASVGKDRSYLAGFIWFEKGSEVHINLRGYPGRTAIPKCRNDEQAGGKRVKTYKGKSLKKVVIPPAGNGRHTVKIVLVTSKGKRFTSVRTYKGCKKTKPRRVRSR